MAALDPLFQTLLEVRGIAEGYSLDGWSHLRYNYTSYYWREEWSRHGRRVYEEGNDDSLGRYAIDYTTGEAWLDTAPTNENVRYLRDIHNVDPDQIYVVDNPYMIN